MQDAPIRQLGPRNDPSLGSGAIRSAIQNEAMVLSSSQLELESHTSSLLSAVQRDVSMQVLELESEADQ